MHVSAHDKAQRRRGVLLRRSKCVQRALRGVVTRLRTRRTLVATAALVLLVLALLALCHARLLSQRPAHRDGAHNNAAADAVADDSTSHVAASPSDRWLLRPDTQHGGSVRVMLLMVSTRVDEQLCYALASAYFADLPVVVLGYGGQYKSHVWRWQVYLDAIERAGLRDRDVVLLLDSDILFSGEDMLPFIDDYIAHSPAAPSALDVRAVRAGTARAPSMFAAEVGCMAKHTYGTRRQCNDNYRQATAKVERYIIDHNITYDLHDASVQPLRYLNGGVSIHRVWSVRELAKALYAYTTRNRPRFVVWRGWHDDQSVFALFYNDLRAWEVEHDVLRTNSTATAATQRGPHGLRAGQLQLEQTGRVSFILHAWREGYDELTDVRWQASSAARPYTAEFYSSNTHKYINTIWHRYGGNVQIQQRTLVHTGNGTHTIDLTPPLLSIKQTPGVTTKHSANRVYPCILHITYHNKTWRYNKAVQVVSWYVPMRYNATKWQQGRAYLLASLVELWTLTNTTQRVRYGDVCRQHHPLVSSTPR